MYKIKSGLSKVFFKDLRFTVDLSVSFRWLVAFFLITLPVFLPVFSQDIDTVPIFWTGISILIYNSIFFYFLKIRYKRVEKAWDAKLYPVYRTIGRLQILLDYITLVLVLYFIGGLHTYLFYIIIFHLIIGSIILSTSFMYIIAFLTIGGFLSISLLEYYDLIPYYNIYNQPNTMTLKIIAVDTIIHAIILNSVIIVVSQLTTRIKEDNIKLGKIKNELEENLEAIKALELRKSKFMRYSAHQLRSPLATVISALKVITKKLIPIDSQRAFDLILGAQDKAESLLNLVRDLLDLSRIREARTNLEMDQNIDTIKLMEEIVYSLNMQIDKKQLVVERIYRFANTEKRFVQNFIDSSDYDKHVQNLTSVCLKKGNKQTLKEALVNLVHNAIRYSREKGKITIDVTIDPTSCTLVISDQGIGVDPEYIDDIFLEFVRSPNAKEFLNEGTGLGLAITKEVIEAHNGTISVESQLDKGTTFTVSFDHNLL